LQFGYGAERMLYANDANNINQNLYPYRQYFIGIDFDLTGIKSRSKAGKYINLRSQYGKIAGTGFRDFRMVK
jgi:hypothetical protein